MRVGLDLLYLLPGESGGRESYARELLPAMRTRSPGLELVAFVNRDAGPEIGAELAEGVRTVVVPVSARKRAQWARGELALVALAARKSRVELLHSMANFGPPWGPFRRVLTVHDLQYRAVPELLSPAARTATHALVSLAARRADRIIAVSAAGADEIRRGLGIAPGRIDVIPNGVRTAPVACVQADEVRERHGLGERRVALAVATNLAHKNLPMLIEALARIDAERRPVLAIAGHATDDGTLAQTARARGVSADVRLLGRQSTAELDALYALADCLVLASLHEGFGLPILEAMARSLPVACSDIPAFREVAGTAALFFDPRSAEAIAARLNEILERGVASRLRALGLERAARFSWSTAAEGTLRSYRRALGLPDPAR
jgi:glycosyltransferase involved in cell wall biosynthesis